MEQAPAQVSPRVKTRRRAAAAGTPRQRWMRVCLDLSLVPPAAGKLFTIDTTGRKLRIIVFAPVPVVAGLTLALLGDRPWLQWLLDAAKKALTR